MGDPFPQKSELAQRPNSWYGSDQHFQNYVGDGGDDDAMDGDDDGDGGDDHVNGESLNGMEASPPSRAQPEHHEGDIWVQGYALAQE